MRASLPLCILGHMLQVASFVGQRLRDGWECNTSVQPLVVSDARCEMRDARCKVRDARCEMQGARCEMRDARCKMRDARCPATQCIPSVYQPQTLVLGLTTWRRPRRWPRRRPRVTAPRRCSCRQRWGRQMRRHDSARERRGGRRTCVHACACMHRRA